MILKIIQPGRMGDIIVLLPIAKYYHDLGYEIFWPVSRDYADVFEYVDYVKPYIIDADVHSAIDLSRDINPYPFDKIIDLTIGFGNSNPENNADWHQKQLPWDVWKYQKAGVPFQEKYKLQINRNSDRENLLLEKLNLSKPYNVIHNTSSAITVTMPTEGIIIAPMEGIRIFDWISVIEQAEAAYCIDSCVANLINGLNLLEGKRYFRPMREIYGSNKMHMPVMKEDWEII